MSHFLGGLPCDIAIVTVIRVEFDAIRRLLEIDVKDRIEYGGAFFYRTTVFSRLLQRPLRVIVTCIGDASQANAGIMATKIITEFTPSLIVLLGIAAGMRNHIRIGDVIVPREVADLSVSVAKEDGLQSRARTKSLPFSVQQMLPGFVIDESDFNQRCREAFGPPIIPTADEEADFAKHVTFKPNVLDNAIGTSDTLLKDPTVFQRMEKILDTIRAADMESGGFVKACENQSAHRAWLVVRGISDFGDALKNDNFHRLASCAAAVWLKLFLEDGFYLQKAKSEEFRPEFTPLQSSSQGTADTAMPDGILKSSGAQFILGQIDRLARSLSADRKRDLDELRDAWRVGHEPAVLEQLKLMRDREDWQIIEPAVRSKVLRFEASLVLALNKDLARAKQLANEAAALDGEALPEALTALIAFHEHGIAGALQMLHDPKTLEGWNVKLSLLLNANRYDDVLKECEATPEGVLPDAESKRLRALAFLFVNDVPAAKTEIALALAEHPRWFNLRLTGAVIDYFASLSPALLPITSKSWPAPADPSLVLRDNTAITGLRRAAETFKQLLSHNGLDPDTRRELEGWRLACLGNDIERQNEAHTYCGHLLTGYATHPIAMAWGSARGYVLNLDRSIDELSAALFLTHDSTSYPIV